jgi:hypothetical protein
VGFSAGSVFATISWLIVSPEQAGAAPGSAGGNALPGVASVRLASLREQRVRLPGSCLQLGYE